MVQPGGARGDERQLPAHHRTRPQLDDDVRDRRSVQSCSRSHSRNGSFTHSKSSYSDRADSAHGVYAPSPLGSSPSPSPASSLVLTNPAPSYRPLRRQLSHSTDGDHGDSPASSPTSRHELARRLSQLAHQLSYGDDADEPALGAHFGSLQHAVASGTPSPPSRRSTSLEMPSRSDMGSILGSPVSSMFRSRFSDLSASLHREREAEREHEPPQKVGMTVDQANKVIAEMGKLNDELSAVVSNLKARQEESDHIHGLLVERAERAAQRIMFLQNRITYLEQELEENDDELQHLRICLKAVEIQMPPHPDRELQRCIATFKHDYQALKTKRAGRAGLGSFDSSTANSPTRTR
ncbi:cytochrome P450 [Hirsutella rhossiliensis]|uniref:Cytochrome P450 n=1 Tax=Hirsutella rhossiliensis TaxID=111463 RepID=A0A9P8N771_9HYPO|nr:cytochrome P450 [Hirsutella rhossiliensis]KAH0968220.1 cytochrome P450 [Hirsutella rhossiliensis]